MNQYLQIIYNYHNDALFHQPVYEPHSLIYKVSVEAVHNNSAVSLWLNFQCVYNGMSVSGEAMVETQGLFLWYSCFGARREVEVLWLTEHWRDKSCNAAICSFYHWTKYHNANILHVSNYCI